MSDTLRDMKRENDWLRDLCALQGTGSATGPVQPAPPSTVAPPSPPSIEAEERAYVCFGESFKFDRRGR